MKDEMFRQGLVNFIGDYVYSSQGAEPRSLKHEIVAILMEEAIRLSFKEDDSLDMFVVKPILRGVSSICEEKIREIDNYGDLPTQLEELRNHYYLVANSSNELLTKIGGV